MKILHFYKTSLPDSMGGTEQVIHELAVAGIKHGIETHVLFLTKSNDNYSKHFHGYTIHKAKQNFEIASTGFSLDAFKKFKVLANQVDIIHYHFPWPFMDFVHLISNINKPSLVSYHSDIVKQKNLLTFYKPIRNQFLTKVDSIIASSPNYLETSEVLKTFKDKVEVIPYGLNKLNYPLPSETKQNYWSNKYGDKFFLFVGVLRYYKGLLHLLDAAKLNSSINIVIVGSGPIEKELKNKAKKLALKNVYFEGFLPDDDKVALLKTCYGVVFPSNLRSEAFGISLLEGAMYGKPMISNEIGTGTSYINIDQETGLVIEPSNPAALIKAMEYLISNPNIAKKMGACAFKRYQTTFKAEIMSDLYLKKYKQLLNK